MNISMQNQALSVTVRALSRISMALAIAGVVYTGLVVGTQWTLFEAPQLPEAVAASHAPSPLATTPRS